LLIQKNILFTTNSSTFNGRGTDFIVRSADPCR